MRRIGIFVATWVATGFVAVLGSAAGSAFGPRGLVVGALFGGVLGCMAAVWGISRLGWVSRERLLNTITGGLVGFGLAALVTVNNLHTPLAVVLSSLLIGVGAVVGSEIALLYQRLLNTPGARTRGPIVFAVLGVIGLIPTITLCITSLSGNEPPAVLINPFIVPGGLVVAFLLNVPPVLRLGLQREDGSLVGTVRLQQGIANWSVVGASFLLGALILAYLFAENIQVR